MAVLQNQKLQSPSSTLPQSTMDSIRQKALAGQPMLTPTPEKQGIYDSYAAQAKGYDKNNFQSGYGIGNASNISGGFNQFSNVDAVGQEINRMNTVMGNRTGFGLDNSAYKGYMDKLNTANQPFQLQQQNVKNAQNGYANSQQKIDADKWNNASISDIAAKYGFDYSRDYAKQQAEAEAQALRNANQDAQRRNESNKKTGLQSIDDNLMNQVEGLDRNYFQKMMGQQQSQANSGLNSGIAADQDLRLQMSRQAEMGASYRDANLGKMKVNENFSLDDTRLAEAMGLINQQSLAREDSLYNERLNQGYGQLMDERTMANGLDQQQWGRSQAEIDRALGQQSELRNAGQWQTQFDYGKDRDKVTDNQWNQNFDWGKQMDTAGLTGFFNGDRTMAGQQMDWGQKIDSANQTGIFNGNKNMQGQQFDWSKVVDQHGMSLADQQFAFQKQQAAASVARSKAGSSGGGKSSVGVGNTAPAGKKSPLAAQFQKETNQIAQTPADKLYLQAESAYRQGLDMVMKNTGKQPSAQVKKALQDMTFGKAKNDAYYSSLLYNQHK